MFNCPPDHSAFSLKSWKVSFAIEKDFLALSPTAGRNILIYLPFFSSLAIFII